MFLDDSKKTLEDIDAIAISKGPGSYTGLRIGVSTAKGLCYSLDKPFISIETLKSLAYQPKTDGFIIPMLDARRMEVYSAIFDSEKTQVRDTRAQILEEESFVEQLNIGNVDFIGNGVLKFKDICSHPNARFIDALPSAKEMVMLSDTKYKSDTFEDVAYFEPFYLKDFVGGK